MRPAVSAAVIGSLLAAVIALQIVQERRAPLGLPRDVTGNLLYVRSPEVMRRASLSFDSLVADVYWVPAIQHYGRTKLTVDDRKQYDILYPLLDLTTTLDPYFDIAYRFGAVFVGEPYPSGAGRPDQAIALLEKGLEVQPENWQLAEDMGFVYYWFLHDYTRAAEAFNRAGDMRGAPNWLKPLAAVTLAEGGNRASSRVLWMQLMNGAPADWLREQARFRLAQLDALDQIAALERAIAIYRDRTGLLPRSWDELAKAGILRSAPLDPLGFPYQLAQATGLVSLAPDSTLNPLPPVDSPAR